MKISKHFILSEAVKSRQAFVSGIDNSLPSALLDAVKYTASQLDKIRDHYNKPIIPSSWYRCKELNAIVSRNPNSQHTTGEAVDFEIAGIDNFEVACWIEDNLEYDQLILEYYDEQDPYSGWIHVSFKKEDNRRQSMRFDGKRYLKGLHD